MNLIEQQIKKAHSLHQEGKLNEAEMLYNSVLNLNMQDPFLLYALGNLYSQKGFNGLAVNLFSNCLDVNPRFQPAWIDLGVALRKENKNDLALHAWNRAKELGDDPQIFSNMATLYADSGEPGIAIEYCNKAISHIEKDSHPEWEDTRASAHWNKALALLSLAKWREGWKEHFWRRKLANVWNERTKIDAPLWDGKPVENLYIHGEQGKGDEIMYLSMLKNVLPLAKNIVMELNESVAPLVRMLEIPTVTVVHDQDEAEKLGIKFDAKCGMGDLGQFFRNEEKDFPGTPYLKADPERVDYYRGELGKLGPGPYVGIAWLGGTKSTNVSGRTVSLAKWDKLLDGITAVSLQYGEFNEGEATKHNIPILGEASRGTDLAEQAALIEALDYVVTVQQTVVHLAGALGKKTYVLTCSTPSWRYGVHRPDMPWYKSVSLIRQKKGESWESVIARTAELIGKEKSVAEAEVAYG